MSRIGRKPIIIPEGVEVKTQGNKIEVKGLKGTLNFEFHRETSVEIKGEEIIISKIGKSKKSPAIWGLTRAIIDNMVQGVKEGYQKKLELQGVGYRMSVQGKKLNLALGFSHPVIIDVPEGIDAKIEENNILAISGIDKQKVGQFTAEVRELKKVEPYKGKGFRYVGEHVRRKAGKKAATK